MTLFDRLVAHGWLDRWRGTSGFIGRAVWRSDVRWIHRLVAAVKASR